MKKLILIAMMLFASLILCTLSVYVIAENEASICTDKADYSPEETVTIYGTGFLPNATVTVNVTRPDGHVDSSLDEGTNVIYKVTIIHRENGTTDASGAFNATYVLDGIEGNYSIIATDGTHTASTNFMDSFGWFINSISVGAQSPNPVQQGDSSTYAISSTWLSGDVPDPPPPTADLEITNWSPSPPADVTITFIPSTISGTSTTSTLTVVTTSSTASGTYTFTVRARQYGYPIWRDRFATGTLVVQAADANPPDTSISSGPANWIKVQSADFTWTGSDDVTAVENIVYSWRLDAGEWSTYSSATSTTLNSLSEGSHTFYVIAKDEAGNIDPISASQSFSVDNTAPVVTITAPASGAYYKTADVPAGAYSVVEANPYSVVEVGPSTTEGAGSYTVTVTDDAGNVGSDTVSYTVDNTAPSITGAVTISANANGWYNTDVTVHFTASDGLSGLYTVTPDTTLSGEGADQHVLGTATDLAGNSATFDVTGINIDKTVPTLTKSISGTVGLDSWYTTDVEVTLVGGDAVSGLSSIEYNLNGGGWTIYTAPFTISTEGENTLEHRATDNAGNIYVLAAQTIKVDNSDPEVEITSPSDGTYFNVGMVDVTGTASDGTDVLKVEVKVDGGLWTDATPAGVGDWSAWSFTTDSLSPGTHTITAKATDLGGTSAETFVIVVVGPTSITYTGDLTGQYSDPITVSATLIDLITGNGINGKTISFTIGGQTVDATTGANGKASATIILLQASGSYNVVSQFLGDSTYDSSSDSDSFTITKEGATVGYTGDTYVLTAGETIMEAPVRLSATIKEKSDGNPGDVALSTVVFTIDGADMDGKAVTKTVSNVHVNSAGEALATVNLPAGSYTITVDIETENTYWETDIDPDTLQVETGGNEQMVTGGGWIPCEQSTNGKLNFGFTVQYDKRGQPKGSFVAIFKSTDGFVYKIKSTSWAKGGLSFVDDDEAFFTAICVVQKIDKATGELVESWGNYKIMVDITDGDIEFPQNGSADQIAIAVLDHDFAIWMQWGTSTKKVSLVNGNITIHSGRTSSPPIEDEGGGKGKSKK